MDTASPHQPPSGRALWNQARLETVLSYALGGAAILAAALILGDEIGRHIDRLEAWIDGLGAAAPLVFILADGVLSSLLVPETLLGIVAGASFGFLRGLAAVVIGNFGGTILQYALGHRLFKPAVDRFVASRPALAAIQSAVRRQPLRLQILIRLTPLNRAMTSYVLGAGGVGFSRFAAACLALLPYLALEVYFGAAGKHLVRLRQPKSAFVVHDVVLIAGLVASIVAMTFVSRAARRAVEAATERS